MRLASLSEASCQLGALIISKSTPQILKLAFVIRLSSSFKAKVKAALSMFVFCSFQLLLLLIVLL